VNDVHTVVCHHATLTDVNMVGNDRKRTLHGTTAAVNVASTFFLGRSRYHDETRKAMAVDDHLDQVLKL
jgi:hypothetical protein